MKHQASHDDRLFVHKFENCELPLPFTHRDHLRLAFVLLTRAGVDAAYDVIGHLSFVTSHTTASIPRSTMTRSLEPYRPLRYRATSIITFPAMDGSRATSSASWKRSSGKRWVIIGVRSRRASRSMPRPKSSGYSIAPVI